MKLNLDNQTEEARIELIPLIDVIFCILTFFLLAALQLTRQQAINVDLPKAGSGQSQMREMLVVSIDPYGQTYLEKKAIDRRKLYEEIKAYRVQNPNGMMVLYASRNAKYNDVIEVLDLLKSVGGDRVALATLPGSTNPEDKNNNLPNLPIPNNPPGLPPMNNPSNPLPSPGGRPDNLLLQPIPTTPGNAPPMDGN